MNLTRFTVWLALVTICMAGIATPADTALQRTINYPNLGIRVQQGKTWVHTSGVQPFANTYPLGVELNCHWLIVNQSEPDRYKCFPKLGATFAYWDFRNPEKFGHAITGMFSLESYFRLENTFSFSYKCGFGFSYQNRPYNAQSNRDNLAFSTKVAFPLLLGVGGNVWLSDQLLFNLNANLNHISNGGFKAPNLGLNWVSLSVGVDYYFEAPQLAPKNVPEWNGSQPKNRLDVVAYTGFKELYPSDAYAIPGLEVKASHQFARINAVTLGAEYIYDRTMSANYKTHTDVNSYHKLSLAIGHEFLLGRFNFSQQFGAYVYNGAQAKSQLYQRYGLVYFITPHLQAGINLKSYFERAQFVDLRLGYAFHP